MVSFVGIGEPPSDEHAALGCCSQCAIFVRRDFWHRTMMLAETYATEDGSNDRSTAAETATTVNGGAYKLLYSYTVPALRDERTREQRILDDGRYQIGMLSSQQDKYYSYESSMLEIPAMTVFEGIWKERDYELAELK